VLVDEVLDVPLVARLRPTALVVLSRDLVALVDDLLEPPGRQPEDLPTLAIHHRDERPLMPADERNERDERQVAVDLGAVAHRRR
jgi:hypothetical protein